MSEIRICGYGGQGVILSAMIIGKASAIYEDKHSVLTQAFGPEARGSSCSAQVIISEKQILYPYVVNTDYLIAMSQDGFNKFLPEFKKNTGVILYENELVKIKNDDIKAYGIPSTRIAEKELGKTMFSNIVMVGFFTNITNLVKYENVKEAIRTTVPEKTIDINLKALELGYNFGKNCK